jgi:hypothetical protein
MFVLVLIAITSAVLSAQERPTYSGDREVSELVDAKVGAVFEIASGFTMTFPKGIDVSGVFTLKTTRDRPKSSQIHSDFTRHGSTLFFDGALTATGEPIVVGFSLQREPRREGLKFVLAVEEEAECEGANAKYKLESGMCSHWTVVDTEYDEAAKCMVAKLKNTGGFRLQFGWMPE